MQELILKAVFWSAVQRGMQLSVRDYQDALKALQLGYGLHQRERLLWLCQTLWARTEEEGRTLDLLFRAIAPPSDEELAEHLPDLAGPTDDASENVPNTDMVQEDVDTSLVENTSAQPGTDYRFVPPAHGGLGLPSALIADTSGESFILTPQPIVPLRSLIITWRRFRTPLRTGPKVELDLENTITERCRQGLLDRPVLVPARRNQARLVVLIDASSSMLPWAPFTQLLVTSLGESQLGHVSIYYFDNVPEERLFKRATLHDPVLLSTLLASELPSAMLIVSDAGAARGKRSRERVRTTAQFIQTMNKIWRPIAWINPMPAARWRDTPADSICTLPQIAMFDLSEDHLIDAIDVLRGQRSR